MLIECLLRDGPTTIDKERMRYQFKRDSAGRYVCRINHPAHRAQLLASGAAYRVVDESEATKVDAPAEPEATKVDAPAEPEATKVVDELVEPEATEVVDVTETEVPEPVEPYDVDTPAEQVEPEEIDELVENVETLIRTLAADNPDLKATDLAKILESQFSVKVTWQKIASILR